MSLGKPSRPYEAAFAVGTRIRIRAREDLEHFRATWRLHHPLDDAMITHAGQTASVVTIGFYHGGDVLYTLTEAPGVWHESCLDATD